MQKDKIYLAKKTLKMLEKNSWNEIALFKILKDQKNKSVKNKKELLILINKYFDFLLNKNLIDLEDSSSKDMLFEVLMARLDILNAHRISVKNLIRHFSSNPKDFIMILPSFVESIILISTLSKIDISGFKGLPKVKTIFILYFLVIFTWNKDETKSLEKTMTTLDKYLSNLDKFIKIF